ncbi:hypothetical protein PUNSTDRAFT_139215 [Punctularia strigosozonata HHB-11173 SS5]|uniref:Uncharacterized protein n=1 Tax=Punctularia strigosozonata (strain HHB-11173) TaxID=741275 RepID=R7S2A0_PUNST|nr:uncharacterized protein PUNSTDRAFT_139215 [Punctularia strigosozonata HHB-11173 SS5]EIN03907.1 hypothetical protein PUNSTDRAFT_139215 [Punctularia strigosozonata HHB-11173 SS5]
MGKLFDADNSEYVANLYAKQMQCQKQGHALWQPGQARIGDVGRFVQGKFECLFNIIEGREGKIRFEPLKLSKEHYVFHSDDLPPGPHTSSNVRKVTVDIGASASPASIGGTVSYESSRDEAAILVLGQPGRRTTVLSGYRPWLEGIRRLSPLIWRIVEDELQLDLQADPLVVVTGHVKTSNPWELFVSRKKEGKASLAISGGDPVANVAEGHVALSREIKPSGFEHRNKSKPEVADSSRIAPESKLTLPDEFPDQCVFVRCATIKRQRNFLQSMRRPRRSSDQVTKTDNDPPRDSAFSEKPIPPIPNIDSEKIDAPMDDSDTDAGCFTAVLASVKTFFRRISDAFSRKGASRPPVLRPRGGFGPSDSNIPDDDALWDRDASVYSGSTGNGARGHRSVSFTSSIQRDGSSSESTVIHHRTHRITQSTVSTSTLPESLASSTGLRNITYRRTARSSSVSTPTFHAPLLANPSASRILHARRVSDLTATSPTFSVDTSEVDEENQEDNYSARDDQHENASHASARLSQLDDLDQEYNVPSSEDDGTPYKDYAGGKPLPSLPSPTEPRVYHAANDVSNYILSKEPGAEFSVVFDDDILELCGNEPFPEDMDAFLQRKNVRVDVHDGIACLCT